MAVYLFEIGTIGNESTNASSDADSFKATLRFSETGENYFHLGKEKVITLPVFGISYKETLPDGIEQDKIRRFEVGYVSSSLVKQVYSPGELDLKLNIRLNGTQQAGSESFEDILPRETVANFFVGKRVRMTSSDGDKWGNLAKDYYIDSISVEYTFDANATGLKLLLRAFSPDKVLTYNRYSKVYLGQKLGENIFKDGLKQVASINPELTIAGNCSDMQFLTYKLSAGDAAPKLEFIQPYLVQYNETFYDFLCRTANRNGEFVYFEDGTFTMGVPDFMKGDTLILNRDYTSIAYPEMSINEQDVSSYARNYHCKDQKMADSNNLNYDFELANDAYNDTVLNKQTFLPSSSSIPGWSIMTETVSNVLCVFEDLTSLGPLGKDGQWPHNILSLVFRFLNGGFANSGVDKFLLNGFVASVWFEKSVIGYVKKLNKAYNEEYFPDQDDAIQSNLRKHNAQFLVNEQKKEDIIHPFATALSSAELASVYEFFEGVRSNSYAAIRKQEEQQMRQAVKIGYTNKHRHLSLGSVVQLSEKDPQKYIVTRYELVLTGKDTQILAELTPLCKMKYTKYDTEVFIPFPPALDQNRFVRQSSAQVAYVVDNNDPEGLGRVRIRYPWQGGNKEKKDDSSPWIRMSTPMASQGSGFFFNPHIGDEVMVDYVHGDIEQPYVIGALYSGDNKAPKGLVSNVDKAAGKKDSHDYTIKSVNGHGIYINDEMNAANFFRSFSEGWKGLRFMAPGLTRWDVDTNSKKLVGGMTFRDTYGIYSISMSSTERQINISSPLGDVKINAFTGITISAPNGNVKIVGKNVDIQAGNKLTLTSGANLDSHEGIFLKTIKQVYNSTTKEDSMWLKKASMGVVSFLTASTNVLADIASDKLISGLVDLSFVRSITETFLRPVDGTLQIKSFRYMELEAGSGKTNIPTRDAYKEENRLKFTSMMGRINSYVGEISSQVDHLVSGIVEEYNIACNDYQKLVKRLNDLKAEIKLAERENKNELETKKAYYEMMPTLNNIRNGIYEVNRFDGVALLQQDKDLAKTVITMTRLFTIDGDKDALFKTLNENLLKKAEDLCLDYKEAMAAIKQPEFTRARRTLFNVAGIEMNLNKEINAEALAVSAKILKRKLAYVFIEPLIGRAVNRFNDLTHSILEKVAIPDALRIAEGKTIGATDEANLKDDLKWYSYVTSIRPGKLNKEWTSLSDPGAALKKTTDDLKSAFAEKKDGAKWGAAEKGQILISDQLGVTTVFDRGIPKVIQDQENIIGLWDTLKNL